MSSWLVVGGRDYIEAPFEQGFWNVRSIETDWVLEEKSIIKLFFNEQIIIRIGSGIFKMEFQPEKYR